MTHTTPHGTQYIPHTTNYTKTTQHTTHYNMTKVLTLSGIKRLLSHIFDNFIIIHACYSEGYSEVIH